MRYYIAQLKRLGQNDAVVQAMRRLIDLQKDDPTAIADLAEWFLDQKAWDSLDELAKRFAPRFASEPILLYLYAEAKLAQNDAAKAEELAAAGVQAQSGQGLVAAALHRRPSVSAEKGLFPLGDPRVQVSDRPIRRPGFRRLAVRVRSGRNLLRPGPEPRSRTNHRKLHEKTLHPAAPRARPGHRIVRWRPPARRCTITTPAIGKARATANSSAKTWRKPSRKDPTDVNALIGYYRLPDLTPEEKQKVVKSIEQTADETAGIDPQRPAFARRSARNISRRQRKKAIDCNQFAWLIANTEGNFDEALKYSKRSVELQPASGGLYDTLAHVYYAKGDFENAVKTQEKALELEPHSGLIKKKLEVFKKALEEKKK